MASAIIVFTEYKDNVGRINRGKNGHREGKHCRCPVYLAWFNFCLLSPPH